MNESRGEVDIERNWQSGYERENRPATDMSQMQGDSSILLYARFLLVGVASRSEQKDICRTLHTR